MKINIGDKAICTTGVKGTVIKIYKPVECEEQIMVSTPNGQKYHAPARLWKKARF